MTTILDRLRAKYPSKEVFGDAQVILKVGHTLSFPKIFDGVVRDHYHTFEASKTYTIYRWNEKGIIINAIYPTPEIEHLVVPFWKILKLKTTI